MMFQRYFDRVVRAVRFRSRARSAIAAQQELIAGLRSDHEALTRLVVELSQRDHERGRQFSLALPQLEDARTRLHYYEVHVPSIEHARLKFDERQTAARDSDLTTANTIVRAVDRQNAAEHAQAAIARIAEREPEVLTTYPLRVAYPLRDTSLELVKP